jgi:hypothetical protein
MLHVATVSILENFDFKFQSSAHHKFSSSESRVAAGVRGFKFTVVPVPVAT